MCLLKMDVAQLSGKESGISEMKRASPTGHSIVGDVPGCSLVCKWKSSRRECDL